MKKKLLFSALALLLVCLMVLPAAAAQAPLAFNLAEYGQQTIVVGKASATPPTIDGVVSENEYVKKVRFTKDSDGMFLENVNDNSQLASYIDVYFNYDDEKIYIAAVVQEDEYTFKNDNAQQYSQITLNFGFHVNGSSVQAMDRMECTLSINDKGCTSFFAGIGFYEFQSNGKYYKDLTADKPVEGKDWGYMSTLMPEKKFTRDWDTDNKNVTVYELCMAKSVLIDAFHLTELPNTCYFHINSYSTKNSVRTGNLSYRHVLAPEEKLAFINEYGWAATFVGHMLVLGETTDLVIPEPSDDDEVTGEVTDALTGETPETPTAEPTKPAQTQAPAPATNQAETTTAAGGDSEGGCKSAMGLSVVALLTTMSCGVAVACKKRKK